MSSDDKLYRPFEQRPPAPTKKTFVPFGLSNLPPPDQYEQELKKAAEQSDSSLALEGDLISYGDPRQAQRLRRARIGNHFHSARDAAKSNGWPVATYTAAEQGQRRIPDERLQAYAKAFRVPAEWLAHGEASSFLASHPDHEELRRFDIIARAPEKEIPEWLHREAEPQGGADVRLRWARVKAGFPTASAAARAFDFNRATYGSHENGTNGFDKSWSDLYAYAFGVDPDWLYTGSGSWPESVVGNAVDRISAVRSRKRLMDLASTTGVNVNSIAVAHLTVGSDGALERSSQWVVPVEALSGMTTRARLPLAVVMVDDGTHGFPVLVDLGNEGEAGDKVVTIKQGLATIVSRGADPSDDIASIGRVLGHMIVSLGS